MLAVASLPDSWHEIDRPGRLPDIDLFISGDGSSWSYPFQMRDGDPSTPTPLTDMDIDAEIRSDLDTSLLSLTATITDEALGQCVVSATNDQVVAICLPCDAPAKGKRIKLGRLQIAITDDDGRWVVLTADVWGNR